MQKKFISIILLAGMLIMALAACSATANGAPTGNSPSGTMPAASSEANATATVLATETATPAPSATSTTAPTATATVVSYSASPILAITCLRGPADTYAVVYYLKQGESLTALARNDSNDYYLVQSTTDSQKVCWLWKNYVTINGNAYTLPVSTETIAK
jgi:hypothetical protein